MFLQFSRINEQKAGRKISYGYFEKMSASSEQKFDDVIKHDFKFEKGLFKIYNSGT